MFAVPFSSAGLKVPTEPTPWPEDRAERIGVNSFGIGGTNVHVRAFCIFSFMARSLKRSDNSRIGGIGDKADGRPGSRQRGYPAAVSTSPKRAGNSAPFLCWPRGVPQGHGSGLQDISEHPAVEAGRTCSHFDTSPVTFGLPDTHCCD